MTHGADARERFLRAIAERVPVNRIEEVHLFPSIRQGGRESGVAVIALRPADAASAEVEAPLAPGAAPQASEPAPVDAARHDEPPDDSWLDTDAPLTRGEHPASDAPERDDDGQELESNAPEIADDSRGRADDKPRRFDVWTASYALTLKGPERGAWEMDVTEEAVAPADTIDAVVRGVHRRAGGLDEPERLSADAFRAALIEGPWTTAH